MNNNYLLVSPCRNESDYMRITLDSVVNQSIKRPKLCLLRFNQFGLSKFKLQKKPELMDLFLPKWAPLCRRGSPAPGFFEALVADETTVIQSGVKKAAGGTKFIAQDGTGVDLDVLICATGYDTSGAPPFKITGINGASLAGHWKRDPESYLSVSLPDFPSEWH